MSKSISLGSSILFQPFKSFFFLAFFFFFFFVCSLIMLIPVCAAQLVPYKGENKVTVIPAVVAVSHYIY